MFAANAADASNSTFDAFIIVGLNLIDNLSFEKLRGDLGRQ